MSKREKTYVKTAEIRCHNDRETMSYTAENYAIHDQKNFAKTGKKLSKRPKPDAITTDKRIFS